MAHAVLVRYLPKLPPMEKPFGPAPEFNGVEFWKKVVVPEGARYCEELDAYVPKDMPYKIRGIKQTKAPLKQRVFTREFWRVEGPDVEVDRTVCALGLTHNKMKLVPLKQAQMDVGIKYRDV